MSEMRKINPKTPEGLSDKPFNRDRKIFPHFRIELSHLPEAKKWEIGKSYTVTLGLKMTGLSISRFQNDSEFEIHSIGVGKRQDDKKS